MYENSVILGLVSPSGTDSSNLIGNIKTEAKSLNSDVEVVKVSDFFGSNSNLSVVQSRIDLLNQKMDDGNLARSEAGNNAYLAMEVVEHIRRKRSESTSGHKIFLVDQLKRPEEIHYLRKIYDDLFFLIGASINYDEQIRFLTGSDDSLIESAGKLIERDASEKSSTNGAVKWGQETRATFQISDYFIDLSKSHSDTQNDIGRFLRLISGDQTLSPNRGELAMCIAFNTSLKSVDLSRQVGAALSKPNGEILSVGANDIPSGGGGQYCAESSFDFRDYRIKRDPNKHEIAKILSDIRRILVEEQSGECVDRTVDRIERETRIGDLTEFGRVVHAEMEAILACTRNGISTVGSDLYCTTFPCHNCAKHIVCSGIARVVFIEPYPKSLATELHPDSIVLDKKKNNFKNSILDNLGVDLSRQESDELISKAVQFIQFTGVAPRRFKDIFSMELKTGEKIERKTQSGTVTSAQSSKKFIKYKVSQKILATLEEVSGEKLGDLRAKDNEDGESKVGSH